MNSELCLCIRDESGREGYFSRPIAMPFVPLPGTWIWIPDWQDDDEWSVIVERLMWYERDSKLSIIVEDMDISDFEVFAAGLRASGWNDDKYESAGYVQ